MDVNYVYSLFSEQSFTTTQIPTKFKLNLSFEEWKSIEIVNCKTYRRFGNGWTTILSEKFSHVNPACVLVFKGNRIKQCGSRKRRSYFWHGKACCKFDGCVTYTFYLKKEPVNGNADIEIKVKASGTIKHPQNSLHARKLTGANRVAVGKDADKDGAAEIYFQKLGEMNETSYQAGNMTFCQSRQVLKKAAYDYRKSKDMHQNNLVECMFAMEDFEIEDNTSEHIKGYIQEIHANPFKIIMYSEDQFRLHSPTEPLYFDATGSVCRKVEGQDRQVMYYALVKPGNKSENEPPFPLAELITVDQSVATITYFLQVVKRDYKKVTGKDLSPHKIETDFSWAILHSSMLALNKCDIMTYLKKSWDNDLPENGTKHHLCSAHFIRMMMNKMKFVTDKNLRRFIGYGIGMLQNAKSVKEINEIFTSMYMIFNSEKQSISIENHIRNLEKTRLGEDEQISEGNEEMDFDSNEHLPLYKQSPFFQYFKKKSDELRFDTTNDGKHDNPYYNPKVMDTLLPYMAYIPLWTGINLSGISRDTNTYAELWMRIVKQNILGRKKRLRPARFIKRLRKSMKGRIRRLALVKRQQQKPKKNSIDQHIDESTETWCKSNKKKSYYDKPSSLPKPNTKPNTKLNRKMRTENEQIKSPLRHEKNDILINNQDTIPWQGKYRGPLHLHSGCRATSNDHPHYALPTNHKVFARESS